MLTTSDPNLNDAISKGQSAIGDFFKKYNKFKSATQTSSLIKFTNATNVNPLVILDVDCTNSEHLQLILDSAHRIFAGYYLQAVSILGANINGVNIINMLKPLSVSPKLGQSDFGFEKHTIPSIPSFESEQNNSVNKDSKDYKLSSDVTKSLNEDSNLSTGIMYSITLQDGEKKATIPINIRLIVKTLSTSTMVQILGHTEVTGATFSDFYHDWRAGQISFWDMLIQKRLVQNHLKTLIEDKTGTYQNILENKNNAKEYNLFKVLANEKPNYNNASNIAIISSSTLKQVIEKIGASSINDKKARSVIFENSNLMILMVYDKINNTVKIFYRDLEEFTHLSVSDMKKISNSKDSSSVLDIMKQLLSGNSPPY